FGVCRVPFGPVRQPAHSCHPIAWRRFVAAPTDKRSITMTHTCNPSDLLQHAAAWKARAFAALRADSSLSVRLRRYNHAMTQARALEVEARQQQTARTGDPRAALAWLQAGRPLRIEALNLRDHLRHVRALEQLEVGHA